MRPPFVHRALLAGVPALLIGALAISTIWGDHGLLVRSQLREELQQANSQLAEIERENQRLLWDLRQMEKDPVVMERLLANELRWSTDEAVIYRFDDAPVPQDSRR